MATVPASSPAPARASFGRSPLHNIRAESCEVAGSDEIFADAEARVVQWRKDFVNSSSFEAQQGLRELCHERDHLKDLQADLAGLQGLVQSASQLQSGGGRLAEVLHSSSEAAGARAKAVARVADQLHGVCDVHKQELQNEEKKNARQQEVANKQHSEALKMLDTYKDRLGLAITRVAAQRVCMAFSLLDECDLEREFSFTLGLGGSMQDSHNVVAGKKSLEIYSVSECVPHVLELQELLVQLNADASSATALPRFVCSMRRAFLKAGAAVVA